MIIIESHFHLVIQVWLPSKTQYQNLDRQRRAGPFPTWFSRGWKELYDICISTGLYDEQKTSCLRIVRQWWLEVIKGGLLVSQDSSSLFQVNAILALVESNEAFSFARVPGYVAPWHLAAGEAKVKPLGHCGAGRVRKCVGPCQHVVGKDWGAAFVSSRNVDRDVYIRVQHVFGGGRNAFWRCLGSLEPNA